jgi:hypothetical protein
VFLSHTTNTNVIFELNERVDRDRALSALDEQSIPVGGVHANQQTKDMGAVLYHLEDICGVNDTMRVVNAPHPVTLGRLGGLQQNGDRVSAYTCLVHFVAPKERGRAPLIDGDSLEGSSASGSPQSTNSCHFLLVRLKPQQTDLLVSINVRHDDPSLRGDPRSLSREENLAEELLKGLIETLEITDWGLFQLAD